MNTEELVLWTRRKKNFDKIPRDIWTLFQNLPPKTFQNINICIFCNPCGGNGDITFAFKIYQYLKQWYKANVIIVTTRPSTFLTFKIPKQHLYCMKQSRYTPIDCALTKTLQLWNVDCNKKQKLKPFDLFFIAPWVSEEIFHYHSFTHIFPESNTFNTYIFSAYNQDTIAHDQPFDFITGLGPKRFGLLYTDISIQSLKKPKISQPYALAYISQSDHFESQEPLDCILKFIKLVIKKYPKGNITFIVPPFLEKYTKDLINFNTTIIIQTSKKTITHIVDNTPEYTIQTNYLPVPLNEFCALIHYSLPDILLTGNQSITDYLSLKKKGQLYYQLMPWETTFSKKLKLYTGLPWLSQTKQSCGPATPLKNQIQHHVLKYDFRKLAKPKIEAILQFISHLKKSKYLQIYQELYLESKKITTFLDKYQKLI